MTSRNIWLQKALELAQKAAQQNEVPVGALVIKNEQILGTGYNRREQDQNPLAHAEIQAILHATQTLGEWRLLDCSLVVTLEPCLMCLAACQQARIKEVIYGAKDPKGGAISLGYTFHKDRRLNHRFQTIWQSHRECENILTTFFKKLRTES